MEIVPDKIDALKIMCINGDTPLAGYTKHNWGKDGATYIYKYKAGNELEETWYTLDYENGYFRYGFAAKDMDA